MEEKAKAEATRLGIPVNKTKAYKDLQRSCYRELARSGFRDIEFEDPSTGEPGDMLRGLNTAQMLAMAGPKGQYPRRGPDGGSERPDERARVANLRMDAQRDWFDFLAAQVEAVRARWPRSPWRSKAMALYAEGGRFDDIARAVGRKRSVVKNAICNELRRIREQRAAEWERLKADIRRRREEGQDDE